MTALLDNGGPGRKVAWLVRGALLLGVGALIWAVSIAGSDGWVAALVALVGLTPAVLLQAYARRYLVRLERDEDDLLFSTAALGAAKPQRVPVSAVERVRFYNEEVESGSSIRTPALLLYVRGRRFPFLADLKAEQVDRRAIEGLASSRPR